MLIGNERRRLQREKQDSRDPRLNAAREAARPCPQKASACSGKSTIKFNRDTHAIANSTTMDKNCTLWHN
ncbi:MAG: hypothetical protein ACE3JN_04575 [Ectobacillus sp.]